MPDAGQRDFDALLRRALIAANMADFRDIMENAEYINPVFSRRYMRERVRILENPMGWMRRKTRPVWKKILQSAACAVLAALVALGALMAVSPEVRAMVFHWAREFVSGDAVYHNGNGGETENEIENNLDANGAYRPAIAYENLPNWRPSWLPDGWKLSDLRTTAGMVTWVYRNGGETLEFRSSYHENHYAMNNHRFIDKKLNNIIRTVTVSGRPADYYEGEMQSLLVWENADGDLFSLRGRRVTDSQTLIQIAESAEKSPESAVYEFGNMIYQNPEDQTNPAKQYTDAWSEPVRGGGKAGIRAPDMKDIILLYAQNPRYPLDRPDETPENIMINGLPALYWKAGYEIPSDVAVMINGVLVDSNRIQNDEQARAELEERDIRVSVSEVYSNESKLWWRDPETNTELILTGQISLEELSRLAESVRRVK